MAACRSLALFFILSAAVVPGTLAAGGPAPTETLQKACSATSSPALCLRTLTTIPESAAAASPRRLAELAFRYLAAKAPEFVEEARRETAATTDQSMLYCLREFNDNIGMYARWLRGVDVSSERGGDAGFVEARRRLVGLLDAPSTSGISCKEGQFGEKPVIGRIFEYEAMMQVTLDLMNAAARSDPALAADPPASSDYD